MEENIKLSPEEIKDLKMKFEELAIRFEQNNVEYLLFKSSPLRYLQNYDIKIVQYIRNSDVHKFASSFSFGLNNILQHHNVFNRCVWCRILALAIIYSICGKARLSLDVCWGAVSGIIEAITEIFDTTNAMVQRILGPLENINRNLNPYKFASSICEQLGYCPRSQNVL